METVVLYGIWASQRERWYVLPAAGEVFSTPHLSVAAAQIQHVEYSCIEDDYVVREFPPLADMADETGKQIAVYGIWIIVQGTKGPLPGDWLILGDGAVFHTIHRSVAEAQLPSARRGCGDGCSVRQFPPSTE